MALEVTGRWIATTDQGFLQDLQDWDESVAAELARLEHIELTGAHWEVLWAIRDYYLAYKHLPNARGFAKIIAKALGEDKGKSRYLQVLFPQGPLKFACKLAGLPKPPTCL